MILLYKFNFIQSQIETNFILGVIMGVGLDFDHIFWAIAYDRSVMWKLLSSFSVIEIWNYLSNGSLFVKMGNTRRERVFTYYTLHIFSVVIILFLFYTTSPRFYTITKATLFLHLIMDFLFNILMNDKEII